MVYPTAAYLGGGGTYGPEIVAPVAGTEAQFNPRYTGGVHRGP